MNRLKRNIFWMILFGFLAANLLVANQGWTADTDSQRLSASAVDIFLPLILTSFLAPTAAQKAAILGAEMLLLASEE